MEEKIDKRTREYRDSQKIESGDVGSLEEVMGDAVLGPGCHKCGKREDLIEVSPDISICRSCASNPAPLTDNPPEKLDFSKAENNPGFKLCMHCGCVLEYNDDGSVKRRVQPELCQACVWRNNK